jgi:hypothetical protein
MLLLSVYGRDYLLAHILKYIPVGETEVVCEVVAAACELLASSNEHNKNHLPRTVEVVTEESHLKSSQKKEATFGNSDLGDQAV